LKMMLRLLGKPLNAVRSQLRYQIFLSHLLIVFLILALVSVIFYDFYATRMVKENNLSMEQLNKQIILNLNQAIKRLEKNTFLLNYEKDIIELGRLEDQDPYAFSSRVLSAEYKNIDNYFFNLIYTTQEIYGVSIYTMNGKHLYSRNRQLNEHSSDTVINEPWFQKALEKKGVMLLIGKHKNRYVRDETDVISIARAIVDLNVRRLISVIVVEQNISYIARIVDDIKIGDQGAVVILDDQNQLVYSNNDEVYQQLATEEDFASFIKTNSPKSFSLKTDTDTLLINQNSSNYINWKVVTVRPYSEIEREMIPFRNQLVLLLVLCIVVTLLLSVLISSKMSKNLNRLKRFMQKVEAGDIDVRMEVKGHNEISKLSEGFNSMLSTIKELIEVEYNEKLLRKETELRLLHAQINPHFLYNALGSIKSLALDEGGHKTASMIQHLVLLFRYNLGRGSKVVSIKEELNHIKNYLALQQCRFEDKMNIHYHIEEETLQEKIPMFTLQPIVENAFVHGFATKRGVCNLEISCCYEGDFTKISIMDDGVGMTVEQQLEINQQLIERSNTVAYFGDNKIGIYNVNLRIIKCYGNPYGLVVYRNEHEGVTVEVKLPRQAKIHYESGEVDDDGYDR
jgi:two-component system sensor histidine kinase YesM